jgi:hypothetical protein
MFLIGTDTEPITELNKIFGPVAPSVQIFSSFAPISRLKICTYCHIKVINIHIVHACTVHALTLC